MKFRILLLALVTALIGASVAFAHDNPGSGKPAPHPAGRRRPGRRPPPPLRTGTSPRQGRGSVRRALDAALPRRARLVALGRLPPWYLLPGNRHVRYAVRFRS